MLLGSHSVSMCQLSPDGGRLGNMVVGSNKNGEPITTEDLVRM